MATPRPSASHAVAYALTGAAATVATLSLLEALRARRETGKEAKLPAHEVSSRSSLGADSQPGEPDEEPDVLALAAEHKDFVRVLRNTRKSEPATPSFWKLSDVAESSDKHFAIRELKRYFAEWKEVGHDPFWQRKSKKVVIAVVVCRLADGTFAAYRGMNTEVSLPSGSLCAERAGIARAASEWRAAEQIVCVAVLDPEDTINPLWPCEVCQSWLAKLRDQNEAISVLAFKDSNCDEFVVRVNGLLQRRPPRMVPAPPSELASRIVLAEGTEEQPWEAEHLVYVDGSFTALDAHHIALLRAAAAAGSHVLVGVHSDTTLQEREVLAASGDDILAEYRGRTKSLTAVSGRRASPAAAPERGAAGGRRTEDFSLRCARVLEDRHVHSVLKDAPWRVTRDLIWSLGIQEVITGAMGVTSRCKDEGTPGVYDDARDLGILTVVPL